MKRTWVAWGLDEYGRYQEDETGERYLIEPFPFLRGPSDLKRKLQARADIARWLWHTRTLPRPWLWLLRFDRIRDRHQRR